MRSLRRWFGANVSIGWKSPVERVTGWDIPYPHAFEWQYFPGPARVAAAHAPGDGGITVGLYSFKLPDVGEGTAEAEIAEWRVKVGDRVEEDQPLVDDDDGQGDGWH